MKNWRYYNHSIIPTTPPHKEVDLAIINDRSVWKIGSRPLLARWVSNFDCGYETNWWYVIKDDSFDVSKLKAKRRYEVNKGAKNFRVEKINPLDYKEDLYNVQVAAFSAYPLKSKPSVDKESFCNEIENWGQFAIFASFCLETNEMAGYALLLQEYDDYVDFRVLKTKPEYERLAVNAALVAGVLDYYNDFLTNGGYICDGSRSINHETAFQDYLEKYFGFRKAYCQLHVAYNPKVKWLIKILYPTRKLFLKMDGIGLVHQLNSIFKMEEICRKEKKKKKN